jgi:GT2 family glycosyltransferase
VGIAAGLPGLFVAGAVGAAEARADDLRAQRSEAKRRHREVKASVSAERTAAGEHLESARRTHPKERALLESQLAAVRRKVDRIKTSRWRRVLNPRWVARRVVRGLLRRLRRHHNWMDPRATPTAVAAAGPMAVENRHEVLCFPIIDWDFRFQRPQQLMKRCAEAGHRVFYLKQTFRRGGSPYEIDEKIPNVFEVTLRGPAKNVYRDRLDPDSVEILFAGLDALRRDQSFGATVSIVQLPFWLPVAKRFRAERAWPMVYDLMDYHAGFTSNNDAMLEAETELLESADLVLASSAVLEEEARRHNANVLRLPNACDYLHFASVEEPSNARPVVGYYGAISDWFDADLVADLAVKRLDWSFLLVGSTWGADISRLKRLPNVELVGEKPYIELPKWLGRMDVIILPFQITPLTRATNPVKAYEIFASGRPLVSVRLPELEAMAPHVRLASSAEEFERQIEAALAERDPRKIAARKAFARENTWEKRFQAMSRVVAAAFPKVSIVVVTYNNKALNWLCLESIYAKTEWPNFEVVVVDNASKDGTRELLAAEAMHRPNLRVILNEENRGFAAASNAGTAAATGHYLIILNNDTVVTRGWASALVKHLASNPRSGLVGPSTNAIANEAMVGVGYSDLEALNGWARDFVRAHDGETFPIPMLAFFCVAGPRRVFEEVGALDERFGIGMFEDDDYNRRVGEKGWEIRCARDSFVHHWQRASFRLLGNERYFAIFEENRRKYEAKWKEAWKAQSTDV